MRTITMPPRSSSSARIPLLAAAAAGALAAGCANDPAYLPGPMALEAGIADAEGILSIATAKHVLPIRLETAEEAEERAAREAELGIALPYVKIDDIEISVEWTIRNLDSAPGTAFVQLNGANEVFAYDPMLVQLGDPDEVPPAPGLDGDIPIHVGPGATVRGLFREDQLREATIDLDQITRANMHPFAAVLQVHKNAEFIQPLTPLMPGVEDYVQMPDGDPIPREAVRGIVRVDLVFKPDRPMLLEYTIRVRDTRGIMHELLDAANTRASGEIVMFMPTDFAVSYTP